MTHKFGLNVTNYLTDFKTVRKTGVRLRYYHISLCEVQWQLELLTT